MKPLLLMALALVLAAPGVVAAAASRVGLVCEAVYAPAREIWVRRVEISYDDPVHLVAGKGVFLEAADGRRYLVIHGDIFDLVVQNARWLALLGDKAYDFAIRMNRLVNAFRRWFGFPYWSLSKWAKLKVKNAVNYIGAFEQTLAGEARRHGADGVICGHIHHAAIRDEHGIRYMNCGDWVESCTALVEHDDGRFEIITWTEPLQRSAPVNHMTVRAA